MGPLSGDQEQLFYAGVYWVTSIRPLSANTCFVGRRPGVLGGLRGRRDGRLSCLAAQYVRQESTAARQLGKARVRLAAVLNAALP